MTRTTRAAPAKNPAPALRVTRPATPAAAAGPVEFDPQPAPPPAPAADAGNDLFPIAGGIGIAILLLGGGAFALTRRRRHGEIYADDHVYTIDAVPVAPAIANPLVAEPAPPFAQPGVTQPARSSKDVSLGDAPVTSLHPGFDLSRYGRHVQAAYQGPSENNPSLSLRRRLARARFFDQRERMAAADTLPNADIAPAVSPAQAPLQTEYVTARVKQPPRPGFRTAFSS